MRYNAGLFLSSAKNAVYLNARVAELVDALDLGSSAVRRESSSLSFRTKYLEAFLNRKAFFVPVAFFRTEKIVWRDLFTKA